MEPPDCDDVLPGRQHNRNFWAVVNAQIADRQAEQLWETPGISWGLFRRPDAELGVLGSVAEVDVLELGCGTGYLAAWLERDGARPVGLDLSRAQLRTARRCQTRFRRPFPLIEADAESVPLRSGSFDVVVSEYGAAPWCEPRRWLSEAARLLRPGGRLVFLTNSVLAGLCVPESDGVAGERLLRTPRDLRHVTWPGGGVEHHPRHSDWIRELRAAGFDVEALHELNAPSDALTSEYYEIVSADWARRWPAEDLWVAHLST